MVQKVFVLKLKVVLDEFYESQPYKDGKIHANYENDPYDEMKERLVQLVEKFERLAFVCWAGLIVVLLYVKSCI